MKITNEFIQNIRLLVRHRGFRHANDLWGAKILIEQVRREYKDKTGYELIDSFYIREEVLRLMYEKQETLYSSRKVIHFKAKQLTLCSTERGKISLNDIKVTSNVNEVTCKRCNHILELDNNKRQS